MDRWKFECSFLWKEQIVENIQGNLNNNNNNESFNEWIVDNSDWKTYPGGDGVTVETDAYQRIQQAGCVHAGIKATLEYVSTQLKYLRPNGKLTLSFFVRNISNGIGGWTVF